MMGLRLKAGISLAHFKNRTCAELLSAINRNALAELQHYGMLTLTDTHLIPTAKGMQLLNSVTEKLLA